MTDFQWKIFTSEDSPTKELERLKEFAKHPSLTLHIRKPSFTIDEYRFFLNAFDTETLSKSVVHQYPELVKEFSLKGYHLRSKDFLSNSVKPISTSFHQIDEVESQGAKFDYVFLSPIFNSISKKEYPSKFLYKDLESLIARIQNTPISLMALGGVDATTIQACKELGFSGAGILGALWNSDNPLKAFEKIVSM